jgi:integrase
VTQRQYPGIRFTATSAQVYKRVRGEFRSKRFPLDTPIETLKRERDLLAVESFYGASLFEAHGPSFATDADKYLDLVRSMPSFVDRAFHIGAWAKQFGHLPRAAIDGAAIRRVLEQWQRRGRDDGGALSASSLNKRRTALMSMFSVLDGRGATNPVRDVPKYDERDSEQIRAHDPRLLYRLMARIGRKSWRARRRAFQGGAPQRTSKTRARLRVLLQTGWPAAQLMKLTPSDVDWTPGKESARVSRRHKGKGTRSRRVPLLPGAVIALRAFAKADAWGKFSTSAMHKSLRRARDDENRWRARFRKPPIAHVRPYDFRHTFGTEIARVLTDERAIGEFMLHSTPSQTRRYTEAATTSRLERARAALVDADFALATSGNFRRP